MTSSQPDRPPVHNTEIAKIRQSLKILQTQVEANRVDLRYLGRQLEKVNDLFARLEDERSQQSALGRFEALYNVSRVLGSSLDLQTVLDQVMDAIIQLTGAERGFLMLQDDDGALTVEAARNFDQQTLSSDEFKYSRTVANQVLDKGEAILTTNAAEDPRFSGQASIVSQSLHSIMATPLRARGHVIGVVYVDSRALVGLFNDDDLQALDALSGQAAIAIDNALLFNATDKQLAMRVEELRQLRRIDLLLSETLDADKAIEYTLGWACRVAGATKGYLGFLEGKPQRVPCLHIFNMQQNDAEHPADLMLDQLYPQVKTIITTTKSMVFAQDDEQKVVLIIPILREHAVIGVVILEREGQENFSDDQIDLAERVVTRAAISIENSRLYAEVQAADKAKSDFVGIVAHDLKAPMNSIGGYSELMLMQGGLTERQQDYLQKIKGTVKRMEMLVSDLADISRIESGHFLMERTEVSIERVVQALRDEAVPLQDEYQHTLVENISPDLPVIYVDYYRLLQVLMNLLTNAYKYTPEGGTITLEVQPDGNNILFAIGDTGIGLSPEELEKLGTKFWRAEDNFTRSQPGTGLGFAITRSLVEQMGSQIVIESEKNVGSRFSFSIPALKD